MIGSTIVFIPELPEDKSDIFEKIYEQEVFENIELDSLTSLDFAIICGASDTKWEAENNPVFYDEDNGFVLIRIAEQGLNAVLKYEGELENIDPETQESDIQLLKEFSKKFGVHHLYEAVTF